MMVSLPVVPSMARFDTAEAEPAQRPDVRAATARVRAADAARALAQAQRTRDVSVGLQFDRYPTSPGNPSGTGNTVSVGLSIPLFVNHAYDGEIARAEADAAQAQASLERLRAVAEADLARARAQLDAARQRRALANDVLLPAAEKLAAGAELAYQRGGIGALDLVEARRGLRSAQLEHLAAEADWRRALADWDAAVRPAADADAPTSEPTASLPLGRTP